MKGPSKSERLYIISTALTAVWGLAELLRYVILNSAPHDSILRYIPAWPVLVCALYAGTRADEEEDRENNHGQD